MQHAQRQEQRLDRREFLGCLTVGIGGFVGLLLGVPLVGYLLGVFFVPKTTQYVRVTSLDQINSLEPVEFKVTFPGQNTPQNWDDVRGVFVIRRGTEILAYANVCTHMGCPVRWLSWRQQILCPCHGGMYDRWGQLMGGPPSRSLPLYATRIQGNDLYISNQLIPRGG